MHWYWYVQRSHWFVFPDSKVHGANTGPTWVMSAPDGPHVGPMNLAIWVVHNSAFNHGCCNGREPSFSLDMIKSLLRYLMAYIILSLSWVKWAPLSIRTPPDNTLKGGSTNILRDLQRVANSILMWLHFLFRWNIEVRLLCKRNVP